MTMRFSRYLSTAASAVIGTTFLAAAPAAAQDADTTAEDQSGVGTIIVTAQRREENLQQIPGSLLHKRSTAGLAPTFV